MANPTTFFNWQMPVSTDLVTDLPADFEVFGQAVDTDFQYLLGGTTGQLLTKASGTDLDFSWTTVPAGGKILQVVQATYATPTTTTSTSYQDSGLTVSITPSLATSKILCIVSHHFRIGAAGAKSRGYVQLVRDSTAIWTSTSTDYLTITTDGSYAEFGWGYTFSYLDSPATTSATTYKTQQRCYAGNVDSPSVTSHAGQSGIIVMEVGA